MFRCAWCMKKIGENQPLTALNVKFAEGVDFKGKEGEIIRVYLSSRGQVYQWLFPLLTQKQKAWTRRLVYGLR